MDNENKMLDWVVGFAEKWLKIFLTVVGISICLVGMVMFGLSSIVLIPAHFHGDHQTYSYMAGSIIMMMAGPIVIYRTLVGRWPFLTSYLAKRAARRRFKGDFI